MTKKAVAANLARQKTMLAEKYFRMAYNSNSRPAAVRFLRQAARYQRQAATATLKAK
jgi:hypothetical protein